MSVHTTVIGVQYMSCNLKGKPIKDIGIVNWKENVFYVKVSRYKVIVKQPTREDIPLMIEARENTSTHSWKRYAPFSTLWENWNQLTAEPMFRHKDRGRLHLIMKIKEEVVGFASQDYAVDAEGYWVYSAFCIVDKWQRRGVGTIFLLLSEYIAKVMGAKFGVAQTRIRHGLGTFQIRQRTGWKEVRHFVKDNREWSELKKYFPKTIRASREQLLTISEEISF